MKPLRSQPAMLVFFAILAGMLGCARKKPQVVTPAVERQPAPGAQPTPEPQVGAEPTQPPAQGTPPPAPEQVQGPDKEEKAESGESAEPAEPTKSKNGKSHATDKKNGHAAAAKPPAETARNSPPKVVVKPDDAASAPPGDVISPSSPDSSHKTEQLLQSAETNLNSIKRQLSQDEQAIVAQIRHYMAQSRQATKENDVARAYTFAQKAQSLSDELAKRK